MKRKLDVETTLFGLSHHVSMLAVAAAAHAASFGTIIDPNNAAFTQALGINGSGIRRTIRKCAGQWLHTDTAIVLHTAEFPGGDEYHGGRHRRPGRYSRVLGCGSGNNNGFYQAGDTFTTLDSPGTSFNQLLGINQGGTIAAGYSSTNSTGAIGQQAFTVSIPGGLFTNINALLPSNTNSQATGVNNSGTVVGFYQTGGNRFTSFHRCRRHDHFTSSTRCGLHAGARCQRSGAEIVR